MASTRNLGAAFQLARENDESRIITNPLEGDPSHRVMLCRYFVDVNHWGPGRLNPPLPLGTAHEAHPDMYCVVSDKLERQIDDLVFFTRTFASIPRSWSQVSSAVVRLPGFNQDPTFASGVTITAAVPYPNGLWRLTAATHGYSVGDNVHIQMSVSVPKYNTPWYGGGAIGFDQQSFSLSVTVKSVTTNTLDVILGPYTLSRARSEITVNNGSVRKITAGFQKRPLQTRNVTTLISHDYFLPGVSAGIPSMDLVPLAQPFAIEQGTETDEIFEEGVLTANTVPTATQYRALMDASASVFLDSVIEPYLGPIVDRRTTSYIAQ